MIVNKNIKSFMSFDDAYSYAKRNNIDIDEIEDNGSEYFINIDTSYKVPTNNKSVIKKHKKVGSSHWWYGSCDIIQKNDNHDRFETTVRATSENNAKNIVKYLVNKKYGYRIKIVNLTVYRRK